MPRPAPPPDAQSSTRPASRQFPKTPPPWCPSRNSKPPPPKRPANRQQLSVRRRQLSPAANQPSRTHLHPYPSPLQLIFYLEGPKPPLQLPLLPSLLAGS